jgi:hypothetical protein
VTKVVAPENLIHIYGATIKTREDLWSDVIAWMGGPIERTETEGAKIVGELAATAGGKARGDRSEIPADGLFVGSARVSVCGIGQRRRYFGSLSLRPILRVSFFLNASMRASSGLTILDGSHRMGGALYRAQSGQIRDFWK